MPSRKGVYIIWGWIFVRVPSKKGVFPAFFNMPRRCSTGSTCCCTVVAARLRATMVFPAPWSVLAWEKPCVMAKLLEKKTFRQHRWKTLQWKSVSKKKPKRPTRQFCESVTFLGESEIPWAELKSWNRDLQLGESSWVTAWIIWYWYMSKKDFCESCFLYKKKCFWCSESQLKPTNF